MMKRPRLYAWVPMSPKQPAAPDCFGSVRQLACFCPPVSSRLRSQREVWPVGNLIFTLLGILSPLYYPLSRLPPVWRELAQLLPATYAALLVQGSLGLEPATATSLAIDAGLLILSTAIGLALAWWLYQWRER